MALKTMSLLLEVVQDVLKNLHIFHAKATHRDVSKCDAIAYTFDPKCECDTLCYSPLA